MYLTPGHTLGTISTLVPVRDGGRMHLAAEWGGTGFNFEHSRARFETYAASAQRFGTIVGAGWRRRAHRQSHQPGQLPRQNGRARKTKGRGPAPVRGRYRLDPALPAGRRGMRPRWRAAGEIG